MPLVSKVPGTNASQIGARHSQITLLFLECSPDARSNRVIISVTWGRQGITLEHKDVCYNGVCPTLSDAMALGGQPVMARLRMRTAALPFPFGLSWAIIQVPSLDWDLCLEDCL